MSNMGVMCTLEQQCRWSEIPPMIGKQEISTFVAIPALAVPLSPRLPHQAAIHVSFGWVQTPHQAGLKHDNFSAVPEWIGRETSVNNRQDPQLRKRLEIAARMIADWSRTNTFASFERAALGIILEYTDGTWQLPDHTDPNEYDTIPHLDQIGERPVVQVVGATRGQSNLYEGPYPYQGNSSQEFINQGADSDPTKYREAAKTMHRYPTQPGRFYAADGRRGLHSKPLMPAGYVAFRRGFVRGFVAVRSDLI